MKNNAVMRKQFEIIHRMKADWEEEKRRVQQKYGEARELVMRLRREGEQARRGEAEVRRALEAERAARLEGDALRIPGMSTERHMENLDLQEEYVNTIQSLERDLAEAREGLERLEKEKGVLAEDNERLTQRLETGWNPEMFLEDENQVRKNY